jgi:hypothetical protein
MRRLCLTAVVAAAVTTGVAGCVPLGMDHININNSVAVFDTKKKVIDGIIYTKTEYVDGSVEYSAYNSPPKGYTGFWPGHKDYRGSTIHVGPKGTHRTIEKKGNPPPDPLDPRIWEEPQVIVTPAVQPVSAPLAGPTSSTPRPRGEGGGGAGGGGGGGGGGGH